MSALNAFEGIFGASNAASTASISTPASAGPSSSVTNGDLNGRAIVVTGCASGIGRAVAIYLAERGARLALTDKDAQGGRDLCQDIKQRGLKSDMAFAALDCTDEAAVGKLVRTFRKSYKRLDGLVNCAGVNFPPRSVDTVDLEYYSLTLDTNLKGTFAFCKHFVASVKKDQQDDQEPQHRPGGYSIVNLGSTASLSGTENASIYTASKHAIAGFSKSLARETASIGIRVNTVAPGPIDTPLLHAHCQDPEALDDLIDKIPMQRIGHPDEVAKVVGFLLGSESSYVTGAVIPVDGRLLSSLTSWFLKGLTHTWVLAGGINKLSSSNSFQSVSGIEGKQDGRILSGPASSREHQVSKGRSPGQKWWDDEDGTSLLAISLRGLQTVLPFVNLCIYIALAAFQSRWKVGVSFLVGLSLFFNVETLLHGAALLVISIAADNFRVLRSLDRLMRPIRVAVILNSFQAFCMLIMAIVTTVSANTGGCKDPSKDTHAELEGYQEALPGFCRNKRAGAAFFWLSSIVWLATLTLTLISFVQIRRHPRSTAFNSPSQDPNSGLYDDQAGPDSLEAFHNPSSYRPSRDYPSNGETPFDGGYSTYHHNATGDIHAEARDPFENPEIEEGRTEARYEAIDPYEAIQKSMELGGSGSIRR
ncbi:SDR family NAD(P)-dependent oxidoreductase [Sporobolomyces koalae]|uniref:SDR family NAD(P)-dependent oxidoreductase n=1 Tax=Sporobolomyces koalae TaxID=500713 RepID=UPI00316DCCF2